MEQSEAYSQMKNHIHSHYVLKIIHKDSLSTSNLYRKGKSLLQIPFDSETLSIIKTLHIRNGRHLNLDEHVARIHEIYSWDSITA